MVAAVLFVAAMLSMLLPAKGQAIVDFRPPGEEIYGEVNCGTPLEETRWSGDDGCEGARLAQFGMVLLLFLVSLLLAFIGLGLWLVRHRPGRPS